MIRPYHFPDPSRSPVAMGKDAGKFPSKWRDGAAAAPAEGAGPASASASASARGGQPGLRGLFGRRLRGGWPCGREAFLRDTCRRLPGTRERRSAVRPGLGLRRPRSTPEPADPGERRRRTSGSRRCARRLPGWPGARSSLHCPRLLLGPGAQLPGPHHHRRRRRRPAGLRTAVSAPRRAGAMETVTRRRRLPRRPMGEHVAGRRGRRRSSKMAARPSRAAGSGGSQRSRVKPPPAKGPKGLLPPLAAARAVSAAATAAAMRRG